MTYDVAKEKLHYLIEQANEEKVMAIYTLLAGEESAGFVYDDELLNMLEKRADDAFSGKTKTITPEEFFANIEKNRKSNDL